MCYKTIDYTNSVFKIMVLSDDKLIGCLYVDKDDGQVLTDSWLKIE